MPRPSEHSPLPEDSIDNLQAQWLLDRTLHPFEDRGRLPGAEVRPIVHERPLDNLIQLGRTATVTELESADLISIAS
jgi:hypothetical protein